MTFGMLDRKMIRKRFYAFFVDLFIVGVTSKVLLLTYMLFIESKLRFIPLNYKRSLYENMKVVHFPLIMTLFFGLYFLSLYIGQGLSPGKAVMKVRVVSNKDPLHGLTIFEAFMRSIGGLACYMSICTLFVFSLFNKEGKGLPEWISGTHVISEEKYQEMHNQKEKPQKTFELFENDAA